jgi:hypothetical protein
MTLSLPLSRPLLWLARLAFVALALLGTTTAVLPGNGGLHVFPWDKAEHFACFYVLAAVGAFAFPRVKAIWLALALSGLGAAIEIVQGLPMVARDSDWKDWLADTVAVACALGPLVIADWREKWRAANL